MAKHYLGYSEKDLANSPFAKYFNPNIAPMQPQVKEAIACGGQTQELFYSVDQAPKLLDEGYWPVESGYARSNDMGMRVFCLTQMPNVTPEMWDWWFGWHGDDASKYKLWHPHAHINAEWKDGQKGRHAYVGRTSHITEYLGSEIKKGAITFIPPSEMGLNETELEAKGQVAICALIGLPGIPMIAGRMIHLVRPVEDGAEMRSRMWMGGSSVAFGKKPGPLRKLLAWLIRPVVAALLPNPQELLVHNAQEMQHLAEILPDLYAEFGPK